MSLDDDLSRLILRIHGVPLGEESWISVAGAVAERLGAYGVAAILHRADRPEVLASAMTGYRDLPFDRILSEYAEHYHTRNPQALFERAHPGADHYLDGLDPVFTSENYPDFSRWEADRIGIRYHATGYCRPDEGLTYAFAFSGSERTGPLSSEQVVLFHELMRHLRRAVATAHRLGTLTDAPLLEDGLEVHLEGLTDPAAILNSDGGLAFANAALLALARARDGFVVTTSQVRLLRPADQLRFVQLCAATRALAAVTTEGDRFLVVARPDGRRPCIVTVSPLSHGPALPGAPRRMLVSVTDLDRGRDVAPERLVAAFGLTPGEAGLASLLFAHGHLDAVAALRGVTIATARSQLKSVFAKTGVTSQGELITLLARISR
ncbi:hypothetical protein FF100_12775 [Methylobacterium terricola]|uniref:DNA-binding transcriptional regulator, CsgD family n=1 Tax=Methylobacterium terricola TaxID=2583531 RepID=A0A5C4LMB6_9HYPH|nr:hypothetical protein [Methylobacterium terricola]TNC13642.1 hypothetical protein FF100_12775 [Methylobacterium terricola]